MSGPRAKPGRRPARAQRGYYGNEPVKEAAGTGGIRLAEVVMQGPAPAPCVECPLRRDSKPGYLGGYTPEMYLDVLHGPASLACHSSPGFHHGDIEQQRHCTGVAAYRANVGHIAQIDFRPTGAHTATQRIGPDPVTYFASAQEFYDHHAPGQKGSKS